MDRTIPINTFPEIDVFTEEANFSVELTKKSFHDGIYIFTLNLKSEQDFVPSPISLRWKIPSFNIKGVWKSGGVYDKRQQYDWELNHPISRLSVDAPVLSVFSHYDTNIHTIACSDAINLVEMNALLREEDNHEYCHITFFKERHPAISSYTADIRIDTRDVPFSLSLQEVSKWWESYPKLQPQPTPSISKEPLYSTWYSFHQDLDEDVLLKECKIAKDVGYQLIILDDGWQTLDNNRGYDYTGDWEPERFRDMKAFVENVHKIGMKFGLWYSVPFCGKHSKAYKKFKGKFLTENHRWAPVFDPRYPEVRAYLIQIYLKALQDWDLDAFKLDFVDEFKVYKETILTKENGRDFANVNEAVDRLLTDVLHSLRQVKPDIGIEFRQQYIGPALRKYGNMFRAFDCPNDVVSNRIRVTDVKLLCGDTAVHSDPQTWHKDEKVELAALQVLNGFFGVPQMSMILSDLSEEHMSMVKFYTKYWIENRGVLLDGSFSAIGPLANYPCLRSQKNNHEIIAVYEDIVVNTSPIEKLDIINAKMTNSVVVKGLEDERIELEIYDCQGNLKEQTDRYFETNIFEFQIPKSGLLRINKT